MNMEHLLAATNKVVELNNQLTAVTEQRDRLAEALKKAAPIVSRYPSGWDFSHDELDEADDEITEALQSLNPDHTVVANDMIAAVKGGNDES